MYRISYQKEEYTPQFTPAYALEYGETAIIRTAYENKPEAYECLSLRARGDTYVSPLLFGSPETGICKSLRLRSHGEGKWNL